MPVSQIHTAKSLSEKHKNRDESVGLVVGSFDVLHLGHINLFTFAKKYSDTLLVGIDSDKTIQMTKGEHLPINSQDKRNQFLTHIKEIDYVFNISDSSIHGSNQSRQIYKDLLTQIKPTHVFTHKPCDRHWKDKKKIADILGITFILDDSKKITSSGEIIHKLSFKENR